MATTVPKTSAPRPNPGANGPLYQVTEVVDGDTIKIQMNGREETLRLIGLDTPETRDRRKPVQCFGREASDRAHKLLDGQKVRIVEDPTQDTRDKYGRLLVYVWRADGLFYNLDMIKQGYAHEYTYGRPHQHQAQFEAAERQAREAGRGFWAADTCNGNTKQPAKKPGPNPTNTPGHVTPTPTPGEVESPAADCDPNYEGVCIPPYSEGDVDCGEIAARDFEIVGTDPHRLDGSPKNGIGCESG